MSDLVTNMVAQKHRLLRERDRLDHQISTLAIAIGSLQDIECPRGGADQTRPEQPREEPQAAPAPPSLTPAPAAEAPPKERIFPLPPLVVERPAAPKPYVTRPAASTTGKKPAPTKKGAAEPISFNDLIAKAAEWGITAIHPNDLLDAVNEKAARVGHKPYALQSRST